MLVSGGLYDQPAREWFAANFAGFVWAVLELIARPDFRFADLKAHEQKLFWQINDIRRNPHPRPLFLR